MHCVKCLKALPKETATMGGPRRPTFLLQTTLPPPSVAILFADHLPAQVFLWKQFPHRRFFYKPHPLLPLSQFCLSTTSPPRASSGIKFPTNLRPRRGTREGTTCRCKENSFLGVYGATTKQILTPFQLYDLQLLDSLGFS